MGDCVLNWRRGADIVVCMTRRHFKPLANLLMGVVILALGLLSEAHLPMNAPADLTAYAMPDGTLPQLCLDASGGDNSGRGNLTDGHCPACHLIGAAALPQAAVVLVWAITPKRVRAVSKPQIKEQRRAATPPQARAPPMSFLV